MREEPRLFDQVIASREGSTAGADQEPTGDSGRTQACDDDPDAAIDRLLARFCAGADLEATSADGAERDSFPPDGDSDGVRAEQRVPDEPTLAERWATGAPAAVRSAGRPTEKVDTVSPVRFTAASAETAETAKRGPLPMAEEASAPSVARLASVVDLPRATYPSRYVFPQGGAGAAERAAGPDAAGGPRSNVVAPPVATRPLHAGPRDAVGQGSSVPRTRSRLNWKPGDPFGDSRGRGGRFRWELMLTTACGTAACGVVGIWILRTLMP
jgi:hypothetical protein